MTDIIEDADSWDWEINHGGSEVLSMQYQSEDGTPIHLGSLTVGVRAIAPELEGRLIATVVNTHLGLFTIRLLASPALKLRKRYGFRPVLTPPEGPDYAIALPLINVILQ